MAETNIEKLEEADRIAFLYILRNAYFQVDKYDDVNFTQRKAADDAINDMSPKEMVQVFAQKQYNINPNILSVILEHYDFLSK